MAPEILPLGLDRLQGARSLLAHSLVSAQSFRLSEATIDDAHAALTSGQITCRALVRLYLNRIEAYD